MLLKRAMGSLKLPQYESYLGAFDSKLGHLLPSDIRLPAHSSEVTSVSRWLHPSHLTLVKEPIKSDGLCAYCCIVRGLGVSKTQEDDAAIALRRYLVDTLAFCFTHPDALRINGYYGDDVFSSADSSGGQPEWVHVAIGPAECYLRPRNQTHYVRHQLPLEAAQATTVHSAQGETAKEVLFVVPPTLRSFSFASQLLYVGLSRACTLAGLVILAPHEYSIEFWTKLFTQSENHIARVNREYERLRALPRWRVTTSWTDFAVFPNDPMDTIDEGCETEEVRS